MRGISKFDFKDNLSFKAVVDYPRERVKTQSPTQPLFRGWGKSERNETSETCPHDSATLIFLNMERLRLRVRSLKFVACLTGRGHGIHIWTYLATSEQRQTGENMIRGKILRENEGASGS